MIVRALKIFAEDFRPRDDFFDVFAGWGVLREPDQGQVAVTANEEYLPVDVMKESAQIALPA
jgi:hypothetical protein